MAKNQFQMQVLISLLQPTRKKHLITREKKGVVLTQGAARKQLKIQNSRVDGIQVKISCLQHRFIKTNHL